MGNINSPKKKSKIETKKNGKEFHKAKKKVQGPIVMTVYGAVEGHRLLVSNNDRRKNECEPCSTAVDIFLGIPYAKNPGSDPKRLRFRKPVPPESWAPTIRPALRFGPRCIQKDCFGPWERWKRGPASEDCLFLNIFSPAEWENPSPVMVFVHGGAYVCDSSITYGSEGIARHLVAKCGVVVVTLQYRLGLFGFLPKHSLPDDSQQKEEHWDWDQNVGLWDQTFALKWVQQNISAFGGDPKNVTIFGQSAGGTSVDLLTLSPHSQHLFHKVIAMAGNAECEWAYSDNAVEASRKFIAKHLKIDTHNQSWPQLVAELRRMPAKRLAFPIRVSNQLFQEVRLELGPRVDWDFFPDTIENLRMQQSPDKKPKMVGLCQFEGLLFDLFARGQNVNRLQELIARRFPEYRYPDFDDRRRLAFETYLPQEDSTPVNNATLKRVFINLYTDLLLGLGVQRYAYLEGVQKKKSLEPGQKAAPVYLYSFDYCNPTSFGPLRWFLPFTGATHCSELPYLLTASGIIWNFRFSEEDWVMLRLMTRLWSNFAKFGDPNGPSPGADEEGLVDGSSFSFRWSPVSEESPNACLNINQKGPTMTTFLEGRPLRWLMLLDDNNTKNSKEENE